MEYCFVAGNYPTKDRQVHVFLDNVVAGLSDRNNGCNVIAPQSIIAYVFKKKNRREIVSERFTAKGNKYMVYSPLYFILPKIKIGEFSTLDIQRRIVYHTLKRTYKKYHIHADLIYSHFLTAGISGVMLANKLGLPSIIANGEADTIGETKKHSSKLLRRTLDNVSGIICVSTKNKNEIKRLSDNNETVMNKTKVIVNAVDKNRFSKVNKEEIRKELGWKAEQFIVAFTGSFIERKGVLRLAEAIDRFDDVYSVFMGTGSDVPTCKNILHCGRVNNVDVAKYLNAADVFVLPTLAEGCSNAIVEAIVCGLPIISSDMEFNYDILAEDCAILIDPMNIDSIYEAIFKLKNDDKYRKALALGSEKKATELSLEARIDKIQVFISQVIDKYEGNNNEN